MADKQAKASALTEFNLFKFFDLYSKRHQFYLSTK